MRPDRGAFHDRAALALPLAREGKTHERFLTVAELCRDLFLGPPVPAVPVLSWRVAGDLPCLCSTQDGQTAGNSSAVPAPWCSSCCLSPRSYRIREPRCCLPLIAGDNESRSIRHALRDQSRRFYRIAACFAYFTFFLHGYLPAIESARPFSTVATRILLSGSKKGVKTKRRVSRPLRSSSQRSQRKDCGLIAKPSTIRPLLHSRSRGRTYTSC